MQTDRPVYHDGTAHLNDPQPAPAARRPWRLPRRAAFLLLASIVLFFLAGSAAPTPLYRVYQHEWGFSPITTTVVFGAYAVAVLAALLTVGSLSDHVGRRPMLLGAIVIQAGTMVVFASAGSVTTLLVARIVQGLATGAAIGAVGAGLVDLSRARGTLANAVAPITGTAAGAIGSGLLVQYLPDPTHLVYYVLLAIFAAQFAGVLLMAEPAVRRPGALAALRPRFALPAAARGPALAAIPALLAVWALASFYGSLGPSLVDLLARSGSAVLGGLSLAVLAAAGAVTILLVHAVPPGRMMALGMAGLLAGVGITLAGIPAGSVAVFFAGTTVAGAGFGAGFQGAIRIVLPHAAAHERAGVLSALWVVSYLALGLPGVVAGYLVVHDGGLLPTAREYGIAVMALAAVALLAVAWQAARPAEPVAARPAARPERAAVPERVR